MAQANGIFSGCRVARTVSGNSPFIVYVPRGRTTDYNTALVWRNHNVDKSTSNGLPKAGAMVYKNASNMIRCFPGDAAATQMDTAATNLIGLLLQDVPAAGTTTVEQNVRVAIAAAVPDNIFEASISDTAATTTATTTSSLIGLNMGASVNGSFFSIRRTSTEAAGIRSSQIFRIVDVVDAEGTLNGRVQFVCRRSLFMDTSVVV